MLAWDAYAREQTEIPRLWIKEQPERRASKAPVLLTVCGFCLRYCGATAETVLDYHLRPALLGMAVMAEAHGVVDFFDGRDEECTRLAKTAGHDEQSSEKTDHKFGQIEPRAPGGAS